MMMMMATGGGEQTSRDAYGEKCRRKNTSPPDRR